MKKGKTRKGKKSPLPEKASKPGQNRALWRFFIIFLVVQGVLFAAELTRPVQEAFIQPFTGVLATISGALINVMGREVVTAGVMIRDTKTQFAVAIAAGCNAVEAMIILIAAIVAFPSPWKHKVWGIVIGILAVQALNLVRIISLFYLGLWNERVFLWSHLYLWQALIMLDMLLVWILWIRALPKKEGQSRAL